MNVHLPKDMRDLKVAGTVAQSGAYALSPRVQSPGQKGDPEACGSAPQGCWELDLVACRRHVLPRFITVSTKNGFLRIVEDLGKAEELAD